jgi:isoquinoline 1-oxidoreductase beta subunit
MHKVRAAAGAAPKSKWRRRFLITAGVLGGGMALGVWSLYRERDRLAAPAALRGVGGQAVITAWLKMAADGTVLVQVPRQEMGQGVTTALPLLVAEELDADPAQVRFEQAPIDAVYANATMLGDAPPFRPDDSGWLAGVARLTQFKMGEALGLQATGGSTSVRDAWEPMRRAGAAARAMLVQAAAARFGVPAAECSVENGVVSHAASGKRAGFGELAADAAKLRVPGDVTLKDRTAFKLLGRSQPRLDVPPKTDGSAQFGTDVRQPGQLYAAIMQCPVFGGGIHRFDAAKALQRPGVKAVIDLPSTSTSAAAIVVVAERFWQAHTALADVEVAWHEGRNAQHDTAEQHERYESLLESEDAREYDAAGDPEHGFAAPPRLLTADYFAPYLAHAAMEPLNCTALVKPGVSCEVWVGNQAPTLVKWFAAKAAGIDSERVTVHTPYLGGGFGRRAEVDVVMQAVMVANRMPDVPVQLIWSREEDTQHDVYRPMAMGRFRAALDTAGNVTAWHARIVSQSPTGSITARLLPAAASDLMKDKTTVEGAYDLPYAMPHRRTEHVLTHEPVPVGFWRSVGHSHNAFFAESFIDECAHAAKQDPFEFRRRLLQHAPRHRKVLETAAEKAGWSTPLPAGVARGIALAESFHSIVAQVAEVQLRDGQPHVRRVVCVIDCGFAVQPDTVIAQMESGIVFGLTAALYGEITVQKGRVQQGNYHDYPLLGMAETPHIEVHIVESGIEHLGGVGEPGTPPVAPAVCNALFALTGQRVRSLPIRLSV